MPQHSRSAAADAWCRSLLLFGLAAVPATTSAQDSLGRRPDSSRVTQLAPITVTATREPEVAPPVSTIEVPAELLHRAPATGPYDLVRRTAGIEVHEQGQGPGFASDVVIRGFTSDHSSDVLLVIDGIPINLPVHGHVEGYADWSILSQSAVQELRVIHGPASPLYGDFAFGGVVEVTTASDADHPAGAVDASSHGDVGGWVRTGRRSPDSGFLLALDGTREQGWRDNADYWLGSGVMRGWQRVGAGRLEGGFMFYASTWNSPGFVSVERYNAGDLERATDPTDGGSAGRAILQERYDRPLNASTTFSLNAWGQAVRSRGFLNIPEDDEVAQTEEEDERFAVGGQTQIVWHTGTGELTGGLSGRADWTRYDLFGTESRARTSEEQSDEARYSSGSAFLRWRGLLGSRLVYDLGGRIDLLHYASLDRLDQAAGWGRETHAIASPKLGARYLFGSRMALLGSFSRGFRGAVGVIANPDRPLVVAWAKEVGIDYSDQRLHAQLALFQVDVSNELILDPVTRDVSDAGESRRRGVSLDLSFTPASRLRLLAEGTFNDAKITGVAGPSAAVVATLDAAERAGQAPNLHEVPLSPGATVPGVARYFGRVGVETDLTKTVTSRAGLRYSGPFTPIGEPGIRTQAYALVDLGGSVHLPRLGGVLDVDVLNLLDTRYPELRASGFLNPGVPLSLRAAIRFGERP